MTPSASDLLELDGGVAPFTGWRLVEVTGRDRERFLASQLTSDVARLADGASQPTALLDRSGRLRAAGFVRRRSGALDLLLPDAATEACIEGLEAHVIADDVAIANRGVPSMRLVLGPGAVAMPVSEERFPITGWGTRGFVTWDDGQLILQEIDAEELEARRVLGGPPAWGRELRPGQLINETALMETAVAFDKGCYLGQETVAKLASHRGAARGPSLIELADRDLELDRLVGAPFAVGERTRAGEVLAAARWGGGTWLLVSLHRELRVAGRRLRCVCDDVVVDGRVRRWPLLQTPSPAEMADRLIAAASGAFAADQTDRAIELLERAIDVCPGSADAHESLGVILGRIGRIPEAIEKMRHLLELEPSSVMAHSNLSLLFNRLGDRERAEHHLGLASRASFVEAAPDAGVPAAVAEDGPDAAEADRARREGMFRNVLEIDPDDVLAHFGLGELDVERGRLDTAVAHLDRAVAGDPEHAAARLALGTALEALGEVDRARCVYVEGVEVAAKSGRLAAAQRMQERLNALAARDEMAEG